MNENIGIVGLVARFKPLHNGAALMLEYACKKAEHVKIGIGSCNKYNVRNPFTAEESRDMLDVFLKPQFDNYEFIYVPDFAHIREHRDGQQWQKYVTQHYGSLNYFITSNPYVFDLLKDEYIVIHPAEFIPKDVWIMIRATAVRVAMATGNDYKHLVPRVVADYMEKEKLVDRFKREFGLETIAMLNTAYMKSETFEDEKFHTMEK